MGADAIVIEGMEAGGHIGPVSTAVLAQEILPQIRDVPVFVAGGIGRGEAIAGLSRDGRGRACSSARASSAPRNRSPIRSFKQAFIRAAARDAVPSVQLDPRFPVIPVRALANAATERFLEMQREVIDRFNRGELSTRRPRSSRSSISGPARCAAR